MMSSPTSHGDVIVKIDPPNETNTKNTLIDQENNDVDVEFSFRKPDNLILDQHQRLSNETTVDMSMNMNMNMNMDTDELRQQNVSQVQEHSIRRQILQGLPPLPPDVVSRQSFSRNQSDLQSPDSNYHNIVLNNTSSIVNNNPNINYHADAKENKVLQRRSSLYSALERDNSSSSSSSVSSINGDDDEDDPRHVGTCHTRKTSVSKCNVNNNNNSSSRDNSGTQEVLGCTSRASFRRMASSVSFSKAKSRLIDPPVEQRSGLLPKSGPINMKSGLDDEEDDPFLGDDLPEEFKKGKISTLIVLEWLSLVLLIAALICSLVVPVWKAKSLWHMKLWKWLVLVLVLICGRLVSEWGIKIIVFFIERNFLLRKRVLYFVYGLKKAVQNVIWLGLVLLTWNLMFDKKVEIQAKSVPLGIVTKLLLLGEIGALLWLLKTLLVKVCASSFHVNAFFDRIQESLFNQFVIETLSGPPVFELRQAQEEHDRAMSEVQHIVQSTGIDVPPDLRASVFEKNGQNKPSEIFSGAIGAGQRKSSLGGSVALSGPMSKKQDEGITIENLHKLNQNNVSAWNMKRLMKIVRHGFLTTLDEQIVDATSQDDDSSTQIRSEVEAKAAAKKIFRNVACPRSKYIYLTDLMRFMREDEALKAMSLFEGTVENERISKSALKNWVVNAFRERRAIALTLSDTKTAVNKLHKMVNVIVIAIIILIGVTYFDIVTYQNLIVLSSQIVVIAFVFGNTCKNVFESIIFLFVIHPFDVGDRCEIDGVQMVVEEMNILTTVFLRYDNQKIIFPNYILLTKPIHNYYRSPDMGDGIELLFHIATPPEKIALIRLRITGYIENKKEHWYPDPMIVLKDAESIHMLRFAVWLQHRMNHQDMGERWTRRGLLIEECVKICRELDLEYRVYPVNVNVSSMNPLSYTNRPNASPSTSEVVHP